MLTLYSIFVLTLTKCRRFSLDCQLLDVIKMDIVEIAESFIQLQ